MIAIINISRFIDIIKRGVYIMLKYSDHSLLFKALSDETRLKIIDMLSCGSLCACDILEGVNISQSTLSYHMKILTETGFINSVKDGSWTRYSINQKLFDDISVFLNVLVKEKEDCLCKGNCCSGVRD